MSSPVADVLRDLSRGLAELNVSWYLFRPQAALLYGAARLTADVDVTIRLDERTRAETLVERLTNHGFRIRVTDPTFIERTRVPEDLVVMKILAGRAKDIDDVVTILASQCGRIDFALIRTLLEELESALGQSDLMPLFEQARARADASGT